MQTKLVAPLVALAFLFATASASAMPKAAEDINSPVTVGADVARPKTAAKKPAATAKASKASKVIKAGKTGKALKSNKTAPRRNGARVKA